MEIKRTPPNAQDQAEVVRRANKAAFNGDPVGMVQALYQSYALDGITRLIRSRWESIPIDEVRFIVASAVDIAYAAVQAQERIRNIIAYLYGVANKRAHQYHDAKKREQVLTDDLGYVLPKSQPPDDELNNDAIQEADDEELDWEQRRNKAIAIARELIPRLGQENIRSVMMLIIDAVASGREDISNQEIADILGLSLATIRQLRHRGFKRLARVAREAHLLPSDLDMATFAYDDDGRTPDEGHDE